MNHYTCFKCKNIFKKLNNDEWNDYKAVEEFLNLYPECKNDPTDLLCYVCNEEFKKWFSKKTKDEKEKMRREFNNEQF